MQPAAGTKPDLFNRLLFTRRGNQLLVGLVCILCGLVLLYAWLRLPVPPCLLNSLFGIRCPACGATRTTMALVRGQWLQAWYYNPFMLLLYLVMGGYFIWFAFNAFRPAGKYKVPFQKTTRPLFFILAAVLSFWLLRNLPFYRAVMY